MNVAQPSDYDKSRLRVSAGSTGREQVMLAPGCS